MKTLFICVILTYASYLFSKDSEELVLNPMDRMINYVKKVVKNPLILDVQEEDEDNEQENKNKEEDSNWFTD